MNNLFLMPVANTPAEPTPEGQPPVEGPVFATVLEEVEQAEASKDLEEKTMAAPETMLVAVPSTPTPEPVSTPVLAQDEATETGSENGGPANSNGEAAAVKQPQASPPPAPGWRQPLPAPQPTNTSQAPEPDQQPLSEPGFEKERDYPPIQENPKRTNPAPDLRANRPPAVASTGRQPATLPPEHAQKPPPVPVHAEPPAGTQVRSQPAADPKPTAAPALNQAPPVQVSSEESSPVDVPVQPSLQGADPGVLPSSAIPSMELEGGERPMEKIGRSPAFQETQVAGFTQGIGKEAYKPAPMTAPLPAPETASDPPPKGGLRSAEAGADSSPENGAPEKTAVRGPKPGAETAPGNRPMRPLPVPQEPEPMTVIVKDQPVNKPAQASVTQPAIDSQGPVVKDPESVPETLGAGKPSSAEPQAVREPLPTRSIPLAQDQPGPTDSQPAGQLAVKQSAASLVPAPGAINPAPAEEARADRAADPLPRQQPAKPAAVSNERLAAPPSGQPVSLEQTDKTSTSSTIPQVPLDKPVVQTRPIVDTPAPAPSLETRPPTVVDGPHLEQPGEPSAMPEIKPHLPQEQAQTATSRETQTQPNPWPVFGRAQAEISAGPVGTGRVLTHPLTSKTESYPVNAPAETIFSSETAKLPQTDIPMNELPKPAPVQTPQASLEKLVGEEFAGKAAPQLASAPVEGLETKAGVRKADKGSPKAADPPKTENIPRGDVGLHPNLTRVEVPLPISEPARLAEAQATRIIQQLQDNILRASQAGHTSLHLQLHPKDLGRIDLELTSQVDGLRITFTPDNPETGKLLAFHLKELQQSLTEAGVQISGLSIGHDQTQGAPRHDTWRGGNFKGSPTAQAGDELKISGDHAADAGPTGWSSAVNYQI